MSGGVCRDNPRVVERVNQATERLFYAGRGQHEQIDEVDLFACGCYFSLDYRYERVTGKAVQLNGQPIPVRGDSYEMQEVGPGEVDCSSCSRMLIHEGSRPTFHPLENSRILVLTDSSEDEAGCVNIQGTDSANREVVRGKRGEDIFISNASPKFSQTEFRGEILSVTKPKTKGWVYGYAFNPENNDKKLVFAMHPLQTSSDYSRYKLVGAADGDRITAKALRKWYAVSEESDVLPIQSAAAVLDKVRALEARDANDPQTEAINNNSAMAQLNHRTAFGNEGPSTIDVRVADGFTPSYGEIF